MRAGRTVFGPFKVSKAEFILRQTLETFELLVFVGLPAVSELTLLGTVREIMSYLHEL